MKPTGRCYSTHRTHLPAPLHLYAKKNLSPLLPYNYARKWPSYYTLTTLAYTFLTVHFHYTIRIVILKFLSPISDICLNTNSWAVARVLSPVALHILTAKELAKTTADQVRPVQVKTGTQTFLKVQEQNWEANNSYINKLLITVISQPPFWSANQRDTAGVMCVHWAPDMNEG